MAEEVNLTAEQPVKKRHRRFMWPVIIVLLLIAAGLAGTQVYRHKNTSPVPQNITKSISFPVYYPDPKLLPAGYTLDTNSFSSGDGVVDYSVSTTSGKKIVFTVQQRPSDKDIQGFYAAHMPLTIKIETNIGEASVGVINNENVYSLPAKDAWLIISTSLQLKDAQIKSLLQSLVAPKKQLINL